MTVIQADAITKIYPQRQGTRAFFGRGGLHDWFSRQPREVFAALDNVSLQVEAGESLGIIGSNGSGKSTLLKILAGVTLPTHGQVTVTGRVASLLELGAGFHPMLTGRENVYLNAAIHGLSRAEVDARLDDIIRFSGIADFIDRPVDTYSSGMYVRIAFSVAVHSDPDIFLVDEVLAVGDEAFQRQCRRRMGELREQGKTLIFVSHDLGIVNTLCNRVILLSSGRLLERGTPQQTFNFYLRQIGHETGIHRLHHGGTEALFSNGKVSLFRNAQELTAPEGIYALIRSLGQEHASILASWNMTEAGESGAVAEGLMARLPCRILFELHFVDAHLNLTVTIVAEHPFHIDAFSLTFSWPAGLDRWAIDGKVEELPPLTPDMVHAEPATLPDSDSTEVVTFASTDAVPHAAAMVFSRHENTFLQLTNSDYLTAARRLHWTWRPAAGGRMLQANERVTLGPVKLDIFREGSAAREVAAENERQRIVSTGGLRARMGRGAITLERESGVQLGEIQGLYAMGDLWTNSAILNATPPQRDGSRVTMACRSRRLPVALHLTIWAEQDRIAVQLELESRQSVTIQEYNLSLITPGEYRHWSIGHEEADFPPQRDRQEWEPLNQTYARGEHIVFTGSLPALTFSCTQQEPVALASVLNTGVSDQRRVAQWLCRPRGPAAFRFEPGRHHLLTACVQLGDSA